MGLKEYRRKRNFRVTREPSGKGGSRAGSLYVIQKHAASHLHYDFRLQLGDVLKSWAVPKGPSLDPTVKRLAMQVEDHPVDYGDFEGTIPKGQYGGGTVMLWDQGTWEPKEDPEDGFRKGRLKFLLHGEKLKGGWMLVRKGGAREPDERHWFLMKERDAESSDEIDILEAASRSVTTDRTLDEIADAEDRTWDSDHPQSDGTATRPKRAPKRAAAAKRKRSSSKRSQLDPSALPGAQSQKRLPKIEPQLATLVDEAPSGDQWLHEIKFDGYRMICRIEAGASKFMSRNQQDWTAKFGELADEAAALPVQDAILDGEVVALDEEGISQFQLLQNAFKNGSTRSLRYYVFDLLHLDGFDLREAPLEERKRLLERLMSAPGAESKLTYTEHIIGEGPAFFEQARRLKLEGIVSKRRDRPYLAGRSGEWLKIKCAQKDEFVVGAYTDPGGARKGFGALLIGYHDRKGGLIYAGKVGTGFSDKTIRTLAERLETLETKRSPFSDLAGTHGEARHAHWVRPTLVAQIEFSNWTEDGRLRHPSFQGLREDKPADEVVRERAAPIEEVPAAKRKNPSMSRSKSRRSSSHSNGKAKSVGSQKRASSRSRNVATTARRTHATKKGAEPTPEEEAQRPGSLAGVRLTHPDKALYPGQGITKLDLAEYYASIQDWILPQIGNRLLVLVRCPEGEGKECFYQKHPGAGTPESLRQVPVREKSSTANYLVVDDLAGLVWLAQMGVLEIHVWGSQADDFERPDRLIFDLDPDPTVKWPRVVESARQIREFLQGLGLESFLKTTGGKGLHLVIPVQRRHDWDEVKKFCHAVADAIVAADPDRYTSNMSKAARTGKIFIDYLRNQRGATSVAPYSTRARPGAPVSVPIAWDELANDLHSDHFTIRNVPERLSGLKRDPWAKMKSIRQSITATAKRSLGLER